MARALGSLPQLREALARGELSYSKVRALLRVGALEDALQQPLFDPRSGPRVPEQNPRLTHKEEPLP